MDPFIRTINQVGIVVRDLDRALEHYTHRLGIGPWRVSTYAPPRLTQTTLRGQPARYAMKLALCWTEAMCWELIEPLEGPSIYTEFLDAHGEGIHHVMVDCGTRTMPEMEAEFARRGWRSLMTGNFLGSNFAYFDTEAELRTIMEVRWSEPGWVRPEPDRWYPAKP